MRVCVCVDIIYENTALTCLPACLQVFVYFQIIKTNDSESNERKRDEATERGRQPSAIACITETHAHKQSEVLMWTHDNVNAATIQKLNARTDRPVEMSCEIQLNSQ